MGIAKVTRNYQVTIPKDIRKVHHINVGDTVLFTMEGYKVDFVKLKQEEILRDAFGSWKSEVNESSVDYVRKMRKEWRKRSQRLGL